MVSTSPHLISKPSLEDLSSRWLAFLAARVVIFV